MSFHKGDEFIIFPLNFTCLSQECGIISSCHCIYFGLRANQTTHSLKSWPLRNGLVLKTLVKNLCLYIFCSVPIKQLIVEGEYFGILYKVTNFIG